MSEKKTIKIKIVDMFHGFQPYSSWLVHMLSDQYNIEFSDNPDFLFFSCFGSEHLKYKNCVKIFFTGENVLPDFNACDYALGFDYINFGDRYFRKNYMLPSRDICDRHQVTEDMFDRQFCNFIYSNATSGEGAILRQEFCQKLMEYKHVDCPGKILNNMSADDLEPRDGDWWISKQKFLRKYKFTIAFENSSSVGYTTEKLVQPLLSFSVPIYWGNPAVVRDFNPRAFINCNDYDNDFDAIIERIKELDNDPDKYLAMLRENPMQPDFDFDQNIKLKKWLQDIIEKGNKTFNKDPRNFSSYMSGYQQLNGEINKLRQENNKLKERNEEMQSNINAALHAMLRPQPMVQKFSELPRRERGNFLVRHVESGGYIRTYVCGIRTRRKPVNLIRFIDQRLHEMEQHICDMLTPADTDKN